MSQTLAFMLFLFFFTILFSVRVVEGFVYVADILLKWKKEKAAAEESV